MATDVFVGLAHDEKFDFDNPGDWKCCNWPTILYSNPCGPERFSDEDKIFWDLVNNPLCKSLDCCSWGLKRSAKDMVMFLMERHGQNHYAQYLIQHIKNDFIEKGQGDVELVMMTSDI